MYVYTKIMDGLLWLSMLPVEDQKALAGGVILFVAATITVVAVKRIVHVCIQNGYDSRGV